MVKTKKCSCCKKVKSWGDFYKRSDGYGDGLGSRCKKCVREAATESAKRNPVGCKKAQIKYYKTAKGKLMRKKIELKRYYGLSIEDWDKMFAEQQGCCAICGKHQSELKRALEVDHNHQTGCVRKLLCGRCNRLVGSMENALELVDVVLDYLKEYNE